MSGDRGVAELASDEAATRGLIDRLRALPPEGAEPDWAALERSIRDAVGHDVPRPWWRRLRWLAPTVTLVTASAVLLLALWPRPATVSIPVANPPSERASATGRDAEHDSHVPGQVVALWLDGAEVDVDLSSDALG